MGPIIRIVLRYGVGAVVGFQVGEMLAGDSDVVSLVEMGIQFIAPAAGAAFTEGFYWLAKKLGWRT